MAQNYGRGFAGMDPDRQREIASEGGRAAHDSGNAHEWDSREAAEAGRKGGQAAHYHARASFHHDTAGHHHREAARHYQRGDHDRAQMHNEHAQRHGEDAAYHSRNADRHGRGFAGMDPDRLREIAAMGGHASHGGRGRDYESDRDNDEGGRGRGNQRDRDEYGRFESRNEDRYSARSRDDDEGGRSNGRRQRGREDDEGYSTRGGTREQHAEAGRRSGEARREFRD